VAKAVLIVAMMLVGVVLVVLLLKSRPPILWQEGV